MKKNTKRKAKMFEEFNEEIKNIFVNNPLDLPSSPFTISEYKTIIKLIDSISVLRDQTIDKDSREWDYFSIKWQLLLLNHKVDKPLADLHTYHDAYECVLNNWDAAKANPYTYRCVSSMIRMLGDE